VEEVRVPAHVAIIMDGNRRWAKKRGLPVLEGHRHGAEKIESLCDWCIKRAIKVLTLYAFSTENWGRAPEEVAGIIKLGKWFLSRKTEKLHRERIKLMVIGEKDRLDPEIQRLIQKSEDLTKDNNRLTLVLAISYGGRAEIVEAVKKIIEEKIPADKVNARVVEKHLWTAGLPDPELIIRTAGEMRVSNFLIWQSAYSELYFTEKYWPDFTEEDLDFALAGFVRRQRRFGK